MKKILVLLLIVIITATSGFAQDYVPMLGVTNKWYCVGIATKSHQNGVEHKTDSATSYPCYYTNGDTLLDGIVYKIFHSRVDLYDFFLREDTVLKKVYYRKFDGSNLLAERLLYDFDLHVGDSLPFEDNLGVDTLVLDSISYDFSVTTNRMYYLHRTNMELQYPVTWIEGVGTGDYPQYPHYGHYKYHDTGEDIICAFKDDVKTFHNRNLDGEDNDSTDCYYLIGNILNKQSITLTVSPNPATTNITVATEKAFTYAIYNLFGQAIASGFSQPKEPIEVSKLPKGLYVLRVSIGERSNIAKFLKE